MSGLPDMTTSVSMLPEHLRDAKRIVIKIGSSLLVDDEGGAGLDVTWLQGLGEDIVWLMAAGKEIVLVSSGAMALGRRTLKLEGRLRLEDAQASAAVGQIQLAHAWQEELGRHGLSVAQVLLTLDDTEERRRYLNARDTLQALLRMKTVPVINENDTVATDEIRFGDNDRLAARVAEMIEADCLIVLSDVDGLYDADPTTNKNATFLETVHEITPAIEAMAGTSKTLVGKGGMITKIEAARIALRTGFHMAITNGHKIRPIEALAKGARHTWFISGENRHAARKKWIAGTLKPLGILVIDEGARKALGEGNSLLPAGVESIEGDFSRGDPVKVVNDAGEELARGLIAYSSEDARLIAGHRSGENEELLGYRGRVEMIHRNDLVLV